MVLLHNGVFCNECITKQCMHLTVDYTRTASYNCFVSQVNHDKWCLLWKECVNLRYCVKANPFYCVSQQTIFFDSDDVVHCLCTGKKSCAKFWCGQRWHKPNNVGVGKFLLPRPLVLRHQCQHLILRILTWLFLHCAMLYIQHLNILIF
jgi:hypothetical protein